MKNLIGAILIIIGLALVLVEGDRSALDERSAYTPNEVQADREPDLSEPEEDNQIMLQPILGIVLMMGGFGIFIYSYSKRNKEL